MTTRTRMGQLVGICVCALALLAASACTGKKPNEPNAKADRDATGVWFVHATDPHIFVPAASDATDKDAKAAGEKQQELNEKAFADLLSHSRSVPEGDGPPAFLVLTGDLGVDPCPIATSTAAPTPKIKTPLPQTKPPPKSAKKTDAGEPGRAGKACVANVDEAERKKQIQKLATLLGSSPFKDIYLVAGNNDIAGEDPGDEALTYFNQLLDDVQAKIAENKSNVQLHNLTRCYRVNGGDSSSCFADVTGTSYRLIGFPSYSFKNEKASAGDLDSQGKQFAIFRGLLDQARQAGKKTVVLSHVPEIDDPFILAQDRYTGKKPGKSNDTDAANARSQWSTWNVSKKLLDDWYAAMASDSVEAVLAGHLHDSHPEIYRPPYSWSTLTSQRGGFQKLFLAPPLAVKKQDNSPIQARGFSLIHLESGGLHSQLYWYNSETGGFTAEPSRGLQEQRQYSRWWHWPRLMRWAWGLDQSDSQLARLAVLLIALLTAFLTIVAIWQIPPVADLLADTVKTGKEDKDKKDKKETQPAADASPFASRLGKTVLAGLGGLVMTEVTKTLGDGKPSADTRWYYIVWFILFFFTLLLILNLGRALAEAIRARVAVVYFPLPRVDSPGGRVRKFFQPLFYWILRFFRWLVSLRVPVLTFADTFINLIQGKNQTMTRALAETVIEQQRSIVRVADAIRTDLNDLIDDKVLENQISEQIEKRRATSAGAVVVPALPVRHVRVNISVLSADQTNVFYISRTPGSSRVPFPKRSMAWMTVFTGSIRWYLSNFQKRPEPVKPEPTKPEHTKPEHTKPEHTKLEHAKLEHTKPEHAKPEDTKLGDKDIVLFDNSGKTIVDDEKLIMLDSHYQARPGQDYQAFVMLPLPWPQRGYGSEYVKGAIHISFHDEVDFKRIWKEEKIYKLAIDETDPEPDHAKKRLKYPDDAELMLEDWCDPEVRRALHVAIKALGELLHGFNEEIYRNYIEPEQPH